MVKVYGAFWLTLLIASISITGSIIMVQDSQKWALSELLMLGWIILISVYLIRIIFKPLWIYNGEGFQRLTFFTARLGKFHNWEKANKIAKEFSFGFSGLPIVYYRVYFDDTLLDLGFGIRGYYGVLGDVVHLVQKANPRAVIDPKVLEKIKDSI